MRQVPLSMNSLSMRFQSSEQSSCTCGRACTVTLFVCQPENAPEKCVVTRTTFVRDKRRDKNRARFVNFALLSRRSNWVNSAPSARFPFATYQHHNSRLRGKMESSTGPVFRSSAAGGNNFFSRRETFERIVLQLHSYSMETLRHVRLFSSETGLTISSLFKSGFSRSCTTIKENFRLDRTREKISRVIFSAISPASRDQC